MKSLSTAKRPADLDEVDWARIDAMTDEEIAEAVASDPDAVPFEDPTFFQEAKLVMPEPKTLLSLRVDSDVVRGFRATGSGYQQRMNDALRDYALRQGWVEKTPARPPAKRGRPPGQAAKG